MPTLKVLEEVMKTAAHFHVFEFASCDGTESVFKCTVQGCTAECVEAEDSGTGA